MCLYYFYSSSPLKNIPCYMSTVLLIYLQSRQLTHSHRHTRIGRHTHTHTHTHTYIYIYIYIYYSVLLFLTLNSFHFLFPFSFFLFLFYFPCDFIFYCFSTLSFLPSFLPFFLPSLLPPFFFFLLFLLFITVTILQLFAFVCGRFCARIVSRFFQCTHTQCWCYVGLAEKRKRVKQRTLCDLIGTVTYVVIVPSDQLSHPLPTRPGGRNIPTHSLPTAGTTEDEKGRKKQLNGTVERSGTFNEKGKKKYTLNTLAPKRSSDAA